MFDFAKSITWSEKTIVYFPPLEFMDTLENININSIKDFKELKADDELNLYFHFPICNQSCPYCNYFTLNGKDKLRHEEYNDMLISELCLWLDKFKSSNKKIKSIYFGGGTPTLWFNELSSLKDFLNKIEETIIRHSGSLNIDEFTLEIHPLYWSIPVLDYLYNKFKNKLKLSIGIQSFVKDNIKKIRNIREERVLDLYIEKSLKLLNWKTGKNFSLNIDLMWGLKNTSIENEFTAMNDLQNDLDSLVDQFTLYHIWRSNNYSKEEIYHDNIERDYNYIINQRKQIDNYLSKRNFKPTILIEYFKKEGGINIYNQKQLEDNDYIGLGLSSHGKIDNLLYYNTNNIEQYKVHLNSKIFPISKYYFLNDEENKKKSLLLNLRINNTKLSINDLNLLFKDRINFTDFFAKEGSKYTLSQKGKYELPELINVAQNLTYSTKPDFLKKYKLSILKNVEEYLNENELSIKQLQELLTVSSLDFFKLFNYIANYKIEIINLAYFSQVFQKPIFGLKPWGNYDENEWSTNYKEWNSSDDKISLYEIFFSTLEEIGIPLPLKINSNDIDDFESIKSIIKSQLSNSIIDDKSNINIRNLFSLLNIFLDGKNRTNRNIYFIGVKTSKKTSGTGGIILSTSEELTSLEITEIGDNASSLYSFICNWENNFLFSKQSIKSAISAIMSRNGSHNIGSHVLSSVGYKINDPSDVQVLTKYIQQRWDFLAQVTYNFPKWSVPVKFIAQLLRGFYEQRLLLNNIVLSEGFSAQEEFEPPITENKLQIEVKIGDKDTNKTELIWAYEQNGKNYAEVFQQDIDVAIPGGVTGFHAFYTILENFIRNSAKHADKTKINKEEGLKICIEFTELKHYVEVFIYDNIEAKKEKEKEKEKEIQVVLNNKIKNSLLEKDGQLIQKDWGIAEMKIAASYLRMLDYVSVEQSIKEEEESILYDRGKLEKPENNAAKHIIKAELKDEKYLGYKFAIPKPQSDATDVYERIKNLINNEKIKIHIDTSDDFKGSIRVNNEDIWEYFFNKIGKNFPKMAHMDITDSEGKVIVNFFKAISKKDMDKNPWETFVNYLGCYDKALYNKIMLSKYTIAANYSKYEEDIETVPPYFKLSNSAVETDQGWKTFIENKFDNNTLEFVNDYSACKKNTIVLRRHFSPGTDYMYAESLSGAQSYFNYLHRPPKNEEQKANILCDIINTALCSITIVDERFEEFMNKAEESIKNRIKACKVECIKNNDFDPDSYKDNSPVDNAILIVHLGVLQKTVHEKKNYKDIEALIKKLKKNFKEIYVTSGKGRSNDIPNDIKFIPFADIQSTLMKAYPEKMILVKILSKICVDE